jgi:hypothetical protein
MQRVEQLSNPNHSSERFLIVLQCEKSSDKTLHMPIEIIAVIADIF